MYYGQSESGETNGNKFKQRRIKFGPRLKLNCNIYKIICCGLILSLVLFPFVLGYGNVG